MVLMDAKVMMAAMEKMDLKDHLDQEVVMVKREEEDLLEILGLEE